MSEVTTERNARGIGLIMCSGMSQCEMCWSKLLLIIIDVCLIISIFVGQFCGIISEQIKCVFCFFMISISV